MNDIRSTRQYIRKINPTGFQKEKIKKSSSDSDFQMVLQQQIQGQAQKLQFSKHAIMRLEARDIRLSQEQMNKIEKGINKAEQKGIKDSLVLIDNVALVVNVKNRVVVTAVDQNNAQGNVYTNIDGAVLL